MAALGLGKHRGSERGHIVGTQELETLRVREGEVEQPFVPLALEELGRAPLSPHRLADAAQADAGAAVLADKVTPGRDDPARIGANIGHVGERHGGGGGGVCRPP